MNMIRVMFFGQLSEICGTDQTEMEFRADLHALLQSIMLQYPALQQAHFFTAVNHQLVTTNHPLKENDIVALMPPFSGG